MKALPDTDARRIPGKKQHSKGRAWKKSARPFVVKAPGRRRRHGPRNGFGNISPVCGKKHCGPQPHVAGEGAYAPCEPPSGASPDMDDRRRLLTAPAGRPEAHARPTRSRRTPPPPSSPAVRRGRPFFNTRQGTPFSKRGRAGGRGLTLRARRGRKGTWWLRLRARNIPPALPRAP